MAKGERDMMISYAQNFEDVMLARLFRGRKTGFYIDIGAMDPVTDSVTKYFYDVGWHGVNVEPVPNFARALVADRIRDVTVCAAIADHAGTAPLYYLPETGLSSLETNALDEAARLGRPSEVVPVPVLTLAELCDEYAHDPIDFLKVDVEGAERSVIGSGDWQKYRPTAVVVEAVKPNTQIPSHEDWEPYLVQNGYDLALFDGLNRFYIARESAHLTDLLRLPPNYFDCFVQWRTLRAERDLAKVHQELESKVRELGEVDAARLAALAALEAAGQTNAALIGRVEALHAELSERSHEYTLVWNERNELAEQHAALRRALDGQSAAAGLPATDQ